MQDRVRCRVDQDLSRPAPRSHEVLHPIKPDQRPRVAAALVDDVFRDLDGVARLPGYRVDPVDGSRASVVVPQASEGRRVHDGSIGVTLALVLAGLDASQHLAGLRIDECHPERSGNPQTIGVQADLIGTLVDATRQPRFSSGGVDPVEQPGSGCPDGAIRGGQEYRVVRPPSRELDLGHRIAQGVDLEKMWRLLLVDVRETGL